MLIKQTENGDKIIREQLKNAKQAYLKGQLNSMITDMQKKLGLDTDPAYTSTDNVFLDWLDQRCELMHSTASIVRLMMESIESKHSLETNERKSIYLGAALHSIGKFFSFNDRKHAEKAQQILIGAGLNPGIHEDALILSMVGNHHTIKPAVSKTNVFNLASDLLRDANKIANMMYLVENLQASSRQVAFYIFPSLPKGPISPAVQEAYENDRLVDFEDIQTQQDQIVAYMAWKHDLKFGVSAGLWQELGVDEVLTAHIQKLGEQTPNGGINPPNPKPLG